MFGQKNICSSSFFTDIKNLTNAPGIVFRQNKGREKKKKYKGVVAVMLKKVEAFVG